MNEQFRKDVSKIFKSHFVSNVLLKLTNVYFFVAGNAANSLIFWIKFQKLQGIKGSMFPLLTGQ